jgi:hypothetical protein
MRREKMKKHVLFLTLLGCAAVMAGCGKEVASQPNASGEATSIEEPTVPKSATQENSSAPSAEVTVTEDEWEIDYGQVLTPDENGRVSNGFISMQIPVELEGTYIAYGYDKDINIYEKEAHESGFSGFVFGVCAATNYEDYGGMRTKVGELTDADGKLYHVLKSYPSDVQWNFEKYDDVPAAYKALEDRADEMIATVQSETGGVYAHGAGIHGEDIYGGLIKDIVKNIGAGLDPIGLQEADLSPAYYFMANGDTPKDLMKSVGIAYTDINLDGVDEMIIGDIDTQQVYDIFTTVNGVPTTVLKDYEGEYYKVYGPVLAQYSKPTEEVDIVTTFDLLPNSTELFCQYSLRSDASQDADYRWAVSYDGETWNELSEDEYKERITRIEEFPTENKLSFKAIGEF